MTKVVVGVVLTAALGGWLVPTIKTYLDRRRERFDLSRDLLEALAASLWMYWKLAMRVAYYGSKGPARRDDFISARKAWDSGKAWDNGAQIQIQVSRSKRLLPKATHDDLDRAQLSVVDVLDKKVECLRDKSDDEAWDTFYKSLYRPKRDEIDRLLFLLTEHLDLAQRTWPVRWWRRVTGNEPAPIEVHLEPDEAVGGRESQPG